MTETTAEDIRIIPVPAFRDNYLWLFHRPGDERAWVVDPGDAAPIEAALSAEGLSLAGILVTHHHADHTGGIGQLIAERDIPVYGPGGGSVPLVNRPVSEGDTVELDNGLVFSVIAVPGHTLDHIAWFCQSAEAPVLFCGDTLFAGGCGRLFEGSAAQMYDSLGKLSALPDRTRVYCAHEYTLANLAFARAVEADNSAIQERLTREQEKRARELPTVPSTIGLEKSTNPFMRCTEDDVRAAAEAHCGRSLDSPQAVLGAVREWKDNF